MKTTTELITPEMAKAYLLHNKGNRPLNKSVMQRYADDMRNGKWMLNPHGIVFDETGRLIDGQKRLTACVLSGASFPAQVTRGASPEVFKVLDQAEKRTAGQVAVIAGFVDGNGCMSALRASAIMREASGHTSAQYNRSANRLSTVSLIELAAKDKERLEHSNRMAKNAWHACRAITPSILAGIHYCVSDALPNDADEFVERVGTGESLDGNDPRYHLRSRIINRSQSIRKETHEHMMVLHIIAWNAYITGAKMKVLRFKESDKVPEIIGMGESLTYERVLSFA